LQAKSEIQDILDQNKMSLWLYINYQLDALIIIYS